jgi:hypothetical protein
MALTDGINGLHYWMALMDGINISESGFCAESGREHQNKLALWLIDVEP